MERRALSVALAVALLTLVGLGDRSPLVEAQEAPAQERCVAVIHTPSLQGTVGKVSALVTQVSPMFGPMVPMLVPKVVGVGGPSMNGINLMGSFSVVILNPEKYKPSPLVRVISITDAQAAVQSFAAAGRNEGLQDGVHTIAQLDRARFMAATPEQKKNIEQFMKKRFYVGTAGKYALMADSRAACAAAKSMIENGTLKPEAECTVKGDIMLKINIKELIKIYGEQIDQKLAPLKGAVQMGVRQAPGQQINPQAAASIVNAYLDTLVEMVKQLDSFELALGLETDGIHLRGCLAAKPETDVATALQKQKKGGSEILRFIPSDSFVAASAHFQLTQEIEDGLADFMGKLVDAAQPPLPPEQREKLIQNTREAMKMMGGELGLGLVLGGEQGQQGLGIIEVFSVTDPAAAKAQLVKQFDQTAPFMSYYKSVVGLDIELAVTENAATHQDVSITEVAILFDPATFPKEMRNVLQKIYGDPMIIRFAVVGKYAVLTMGRDSLPRIKQTIELVKADGGSDLQQQPEFVAATKGFPKQTNLLLYINTHEVAKLVQALGPAFAPPGAAPAAPAGAQAEPGVKGGIAGYLAINGSRVEGELFVTQEFISSLQSLFMGQMGGMPPGGGAPPPRKAPPQPR